jgi:His-Xaa-Ser system protein HxsD
MASEPVALVFDERVFSIEAVQKAAYRFIHLFTMDMNLSEGSIYCTLTPSQSHSPEGLEHYISEFKKEVLDQHLRIKIKTETEAVRNLILGVAFSNSGLLAGE